MFDAGYRMLGAVAQGWSHIWGYWYFFRQSWRKELTPLKRPWWWERLRAGGERDDRVWDGWMASLTQWHGFCVDSGTWWWTGRPGVLQFMGLKRVRHDWVTELNWILIPACASSSPAFRMMYSAYKLKKQGNDIQPWCTPVLIWNQSVVLRPVLTVASWPADRYLNRQARWSGILISLLWSHSQRLWHSQ